MFHNSLETRLCSIRSDDTVKRVLIRKKAFKKKKCIKRSGRKNSRHLYTNKMFAIAFAVKRFRIVIYLARPATLFFRVRIRNGFQVPCR